MTSAATDLERLKSLLGATILGSKESAGELTICVPTAQIAEVLKTLRTDPELDYGYFSECLCVDYSKWTFPRDFAEPKRFEVVYNLMSLKSYNRVFVKVTVCLLYTSDAADE